MSLRSPAIAQGARQSAWRSIVRNTGWLLAGKVISALLSLAYLGLATRALGPAAFGEFVLILGTGQAIATLVSFESWQLLLRFGMDHLQRGQEASHGHLIAFCMLLDMAGAIVGAFLSVAAIALLAPVFGWSEALQTQSLVFCLVLLASFRSAATGVMRLHDRFGASAFAETMMPVLRMIGVLIVLAMGASVTRLLIAWAVAEFLTAIVHWVLAYQTLRLRRDWFHKPGLLAVPREHPGFWHFTMITNAESTLGLVGKQFAVLLVGATVSPAAAGGYRIAHQLGQALANVSDMLSRATYSEIMRARSGQTADQLVQLFRSASVIAFVTSALMICVLLIFGRDLLLLMAGEQFAFAYPLVLILGIAAALDAGGVSFAPALLAKDRGWLTFRIRLLSTAILCAGLIYLLDSMGTIGAALATLTASLLALLMLGIAVWNVVTRSSDEHSSDQLA